ncbi:hypothetical protein D3H55_14085 [Bacillus salacetis]|uniref:Lipoprotein n=1 Tax=Bacillus salacetis TaxID=2315464 RepID=A0A3A1QZX3_9BACI|nr:hypothetical protein [Bacillus salacetis]RIW32005.1 hypothetical protein D3H55_14085 [Bacillus salacetis]
MLKKHLSFLILMAVLFLIGCSAKQGLPVISINENSDYEKTFADLSLGVLFDFEFHLPHADDRWVTLWVEEYRNGAKETEPLTQLSYGNSPEQVEKGNLGFGIINPNSEDPQVFLYGPGVKSMPEQVKTIFKQDMMTSGEYALGEDEVELNLGETKILAVYRGTSGNSMRTIDFQDEETIDYVIEHEDTVLLLKIKVEEKKAEQ